MDKKNKENSFYSIVEVSEKFVISQKTVRRHIASAKLKAIKVGGVYRIPKSSLEDFINLNEENYSFDLDNLKTISENHSNIKLVFVTHLLGIPAQVEEYRKLFPEALFIDDVCESHGCLDVGGNKIGKDSLGATFSFYFGHHISTIEGGMVCTDDEDFYHLLLSEN